MQTRRFANNAQLAAQRAIGAEMSVEMARKHKSPSDADLATLLSAAPQDCEPFWRRQFRIVRDISPDNKKFAKLQEVLICEFQCLSESFCETDKQCGQDDPDTHQSLPQTI